MVKTSNHKGMVIEMDIQALSKVYKVTKLEEADIPAVYELCQGNPLYYKHCPPAVSMESIRKDMNALPDNKTPADKYYVGFWKENELIAVMDLITEYPDRETAFIGFFMVDAKFQGNGIGSEIIEEACGCLQKRFSNIRLGYVKGNMQSEHFWTKNGFLPTGKISKTTDYDVVVMLRKLG